jgi:hypothetical protein
MSALLRSLQYFLRRSHHDADLRDTSPRDGMLAAVGMLAAWLPARRAARLDAAKVLRDEQDGLPRDSRVTALRMEPLPSPDRPCMAFVGDRFERAANGQPLGWMFRRRAAHR